MGAECARSQSRSLFTWAFSPGSSGQRWSSTQSLRDQDGQVLGLDRSETEDPEDACVIVLDKRDDRIVSPCQAWLVSEIMANAASSINVLTERGQVMPPSSGFHVAFAGRFCCPNNCP